MESFAAVTGRSLPRGLIMFRILLIITVGAAILVERGAVVISECYSLGALWWGHDSTNCSMSIPHSVSQFDSHLVHLARQMILHLLKLFG